MGGLWDVTINPYEYAYGGYVEGSNSMIITRLVKLHPLPFPSRQLSRRMGKLIDFDEKRVFPYRPQPSNYIITLLHDYREV